MARKSRNGNGNGNNEPVANASENGRRSAGMAITSRHTLLTDSWTADVEALETAIGRFKSERPLTNDCQIALFEIARDAHLHVNVTHRYATRKVRGWAGPASVPDGFVHNRTFGDTQPSRIIRHIRDMVFAARI
jgi:hypothetical protein